MTPEQEPIDAESVDTTALTTVQKGELFRLDHDCSGPLIAARQLVAIMVKDCIGPKFITPIKTKEGVKNYPRVEWWTTAGAALGLFPQEESCKVVNDPLTNKLAYEAYVTVRRHGEIVARASAICSTAEKRWSTADAYAVRSMAVTRATAKAYRLGLSFLAVLAGLEPTPAEEMPTTDDRSTATPPPQSAAPAQTAAPAEPAVPQTQPPPGQLQHGAPVYLVQASWFTKEGTNSKGEWTLTKFEDTLGNKYSTFSVRLASIAGEAAEAGTPVLIDWLPDDNYPDTRNIKDLIPATLTGGAYEPPPAEPSPEGLPTNVESASEKIVSVEDRGPRTVGGASVNVWSIITDTGRYGTFDTLVAEAAKACIGDEVMVFYTADPPRGNKAVRIETIPF